VPKLAAENTFTADTDSLNFYRSRERYKRWLWAFRSVRIVKTLHEMFTLSKDGATTPDVSHAS
jgi:hypothetical protein